MIVGSVRSIFLNDSGQLGKNHIINNETDRLRLKFNYTKTRISSIDFDDILMN